MRRAQSEMVVLLVEDEWIVRAAIGGRLEDAGWTVLEAGSGEEAIAVFQANEDIDVLVTDIQLGGEMTGWDVAEACRAQFPEMPIIYASANSPDNVRRISGSTFFRKPCGASELVEACQTLAKFSAPDTD